MKSKTLDNSTHASNPGGHSITRAEYVRYEGNNAFTRAILHLTSFFPLSWKNVKFFNGGFKWQRAKERFLYGCICPAVVVDAERNLVAVYTDLDTQSMQRFHVIKIYVEKLRLLPRAANNGERFATIATYFGRRDKPRWETFMPKLVDCVSTNPELCAATKAKISDGDWQALEVGLKQIPNPPRVGQYDIELPDAVKRRL